MPINQTLYTALQQAFGGVNIANEGQRYVPHPRDRRPIQSGEYYQVNCPFCGDKRKRLWINHRFNVSDESGNNHRHLCVCFNERCIDSRQRQEELLSRIFPFGYGATQTLSDLGRCNLVDAPSSVPTPSVTWPACFPLSDPTSRLAVEYLSCRGFDLCEIDQNWQVHYCSECSYTSPSITNRLIIPVYGVVANLGAPCDFPCVGWQARSINTHCDEPKYLSMRGFRKSEVLYGLPRVLTTSGPVVVVEGPTDVWRLGSHAVATLGKSISPAQVRLLITHCSNRPIVILMDRDAQTEAQQTQSRIRRERRQWSDSAPVITISPPNGYSDAGETPRSVLWDHIHHALGTHTGACAS